MMIMIIMMMNCLCEKVERRKVISFISSLDQCHRFSSSSIYDTPRAGFESAQNLSVDLVDRSCAEVKTATPRFVS